MSKTVYYPRIPSINFYDSDGIVSGGITGSKAIDKFHRMVKAGRMPRLSLRSKVQVAI